MIDLDPVFAAALRAELVARPSRRRRARRPLVVTVVAVAGFAVAGGAAAAVNAALPGGTVSAELGVPVVESHVGSATLDAGDRPDGANAVRVEVGCGSAGTLAFADGAFLVCEPPFSSAFVTSFDVVVAPGSTGTSMTAPDGMRWTSRVVWISSRITDLATNSAGDTFGVDNTRAHPDLIAVVATNGRTGYSYASDLEGPMPTSPAQALEWQERDAGKTFFVPVYESDGTTVIGRFQIGP